jgi:hypothetical protein
MDIIAKAVLEWCSDKCESCNAFCSRVSKYPEFDASECIVEKIRRLAEFVLERER